MTILRKKLPVVAALLVAVLIGFHAASATVVAAGTTTLPAMVGNETRDPYIHGTAVIALAFFVGYFVGDMMCHWGGRSGSDVLTAPGIQDKAFDF